MINETETCAGSVMKNVSVGKTIIKFKFVFHIPLPICKNRKIGLLQEWVDSKNACE